MCQASDSQQPPQWEIITYAGLIFTMSLIGIYCNSLSSLVLHKHYVFRNPFGRLTLVHASANVGVLLIFAFWVVPLTIFEFDEEVQWLNRQMGQLILFFQEIALHAILFVSINRFTCICNPIVYRKFFTNKVTNGIIVFIVIICILYYISYFLPGCGIYFDSYYILWSFLETPCGHIMSFYMDFSYNVSLFGFVGCLDFSSLVLLLSKKQKFDGTLSKAEIRSRNARDLRFFVQAVITSLVYAFTLFTFDVLTCYVVTIKNTFFAGTFAWCSAHMISGFILIIFNKEIRRAVVHTSEILKSTKVVDLTSQPSTFNRATTLTMAQNVNRTRRVSFWKIKPRTAANSTTQLETSNIE